MKPSENPSSLHERFTHQLEEWIASPALRQPIEADLSLRTVCLPDDALWQPCPIPNTEVRMLEYREGDNARFTALLRLSAEASSADLGCWKKLEILVAGGELMLDELGVPGGHYLRLPELNHAMSLRNAPSHWTMDAQIYLAFAGGHFPKEDDEPRVIDTRPGDAWLPGPIEGISVMPLHVHGSANAMLLRWTENVSFQPNIDPQGEELLVLQGALVDETGVYPPGTWIRNPKISWQHWSGTQGTVVFYKSGHFHAPNDGE